MKAVILLAFGILLFTVPARASIDIAAIPPYPETVKTTVHHYREHFPRQHGYAVARRYRGGGLVTVDTAAGIRITVAASVAGNFQGFIRDLVAMGGRFRHIGCYSATGHIRNSMHHVGKACDFDQTGWNRTPDRIMYSERVTELAHKWGFVSGCEFRSRRDCGHIGMDFAPSAHRHYARRYTHRRYAGR